MKLLFIAEGKSTWRSLLPPSIALCFLFSLISISLTQIFLFLSILIWAILLIKEKQKLSFPGFFLPLLVYAGLSLISSFFSVNPEISLKDSKELLLFIIVPLVYTAFSEEKQLDKIILALLASASLSSLYSLFYFIFSAVPGERIKGFMGHYMTQAGLLLLFICVALSFIFFSRSKLRFLWGAGLALSLIALVLTLTRSAWIGLVVVACFILLLYKPKALIIMPLLLILFFIVAPRPAKQRALTVFSLRGYSNMQRIEYARAGIKIIRDFPLFGTGPDTVDMVFQDPKYGLSVEAKRNVHLHNNVTQIAAERGIPTLFSWLVFLGWAFFSLLKLLKKKDSLLTPYVVASLASVLALVTAGLFEYNFGDSEITTLFLFLLTLPFSLLRIQKKKSRIEY